MNTNKPLTIMFATALWVAAPLAHAMYMDEFQGLTFTFDQLDADTLSFDIAGTPSGDWTGVNYLGAFDLKDLGLDFSTDTGVLDGDGVSNLMGDKSQLSASNLDCSKSTGQKGSICFSFGQGLLLGTVPIDLNFTIDFSAPLNISSAGPHLQIAFLDELGGPKVGSLYSQNVGENVPEPGTLAMVSIGLLGLGFRYRKGISNR
jgi:hypothetical protein